MFSVQCIRIKRGSKCCGCRKLCYKNPSLDLRSKLNFFLYKFEFIELGVLIRTVVMVVSKFGWD